ncbi:SPTB2 protein, partial [Geococcyx californianus]|nr:SPTB2 protein [Geococcyx californianus]
YQPCEPASVRERVAALELRYRQLVELARRRRARLEESRRLWKFFWDAGEEEAWMRQQERLLLADDVGRDLASSARLLRRHDAVRQELSGRAGPLEHALAQGRALVAQDRSGAAEVAQRVRELEERWRALANLAAQRERRLREAAGVFQLQADAGDVEAWLEEAWRVVASAELGRDEDSTRSLARQHRELQEEVRSHRRAIDVLHEQAGSLPPALADGVATRLPALEGRYQELAARAERRQRELDDALGFYTMRSEADACALWLGEKERWLRAMAVPQKLEDLEVVQQRLETLEPEMKKLETRVATVNRVAEELLAADQRNQESIRATRQELNDRWERVRALAERRKEALTSALNIQNFHLECDETAAWMRDKTHAIESTRDSGDDVASASALQRKLCGIARDLAAIEGKVKELRAVADALASEREEKTPQIRARAAAMEAAWEELRRELRRRQEALGEAAELQRLLRDAVALQAWLARAQAAAACDDVPATLAEAERMLSQHESLGKEIAQRGDDYRAACAAGRQAAAAAEEEEEDARRRSLRLRLDALDAGWEELAQLWQRRQQRLRHDVAFRLFLRDCEQAAGSLAAQEFALAHVELPASLPGAEAAVKKQEDLVGAVDVLGERAQALAAAGRRLVAEGNPHEQEVQELVEALEGRQRRNREAAQELLERLRDNRELQRFLQDAQEVR